MKIIHIIFVVFLLASCGQKEGVDSEWKIIYKNDANGVTLQGDKSKLIDAARLGYPIRVGFGGRSKTDTSRSIEHIADADFISIANGKEVFAQINEIYGQKPHLDSDTLRIDLKHKNKWTIIIGSNGEISTLSRYFNSDDSEESKSGNRGATWYTKGQLELKDYDVSPLWR